MPELVPVEFDPFKAGGTPDDFRARYSGAAEKAGKALGVDPSVLLGQWGLETGWGKSVIPGTNNLGNIKDFSGSGTAATDNMTGSRDKYRKYDTPEAFADDFTSLIQRKYPGAVNAKTPEDFAKALKSGGYAEDPGYVTKVTQAVKMAAPKGLIQRGVEAIIPSAEAAQPAAEPQLVPVDFDPFAKKAEPASAGSRFLAGAVQGTKDLAGGAVRGAGSIGATLLAPVDMASDAMAGKGWSLESNRQRRTDMDSALQNMGVNTNSLAFQGGKLAAEVAGTAGTGGVLAKGAQAAGAAPRIVNALQSSGMSLGGAPATTLGQSAGNALTRIAGGAATGGASAALVNPEDAGSGALIGGAIPAVASALAPAGRAIGNRLADNAATRTADLSRRAPLIQTLEDGIGAGYVVPPSSVEPSLRNTIKESIGGKVATAQVASTRNQGVTDNLVRKSLGLADDAPLSVEALKKYRADMHATGYDPLRQIGTVQAGPTFTADLDDVVRQYTGKGTIPAIQKTEIADLVAAHKSNQFDAGDAVDAIRILRDDASDAFRKGDSALGKAQKAIANAYESALESSLPQGSDLLKNYQSARQNIAKSFTVEDALKEGTGSVDARKLANALQGGTPLDGELLTAARFASAFPRATQPVSQVGGAGVHNLKAGASAGGAMLGALSGGPVGAAIAAAAPWVVPPIMRAQMFSGRAQNALIPRQGGGNLLRLAQNPQTRNLLELGARSAPVLNADH